MLESDVIIIGAGVTGLAAAQVLGGAAMVLEQDARVGGLVRTECFQGYWFDRVAHLIHFQNPAIEAFMLGQWGDQLSPLPLRAWVETSAGCLKYPFQMHLHGLPYATVVDCLRDLATVTFQPSTSPIRHFEDFLARTFGLAMGELFLLPYNRKMWKRPLNGLAPAGFQWSIPLPDWTQVVRGAIDPDFQYTSYNQHGFYPQPQADSPVRGMEVLPYMMSQRVPHLRLQHRVVALDLDEQVIVTETPAGLSSFHYRENCLATLPLPRLFSICQQAPAELKAQVRSLPYNRVITVTFSMAGERPRDIGHWRYYADESLVFNRLIFMHEFDPLLAPPNGWGFMAEITEDAATPRQSNGSILERVKQDLGRIGIIPRGARIIDEHVLGVDPAYVVFTPESQQIVEQARAFLRENRVTPLGRYGHWEYSTIPQAIHAGFRYGQEMLAARPI